MIAKSPWAKFKRGGRRQVRRVKIISKNPIYVPIITGFILILATFLLLGIFGRAKAIEVTPNSKIVIISHDGIKQIVPSNDKTVGQLIDRLRIHLNKGDVIQPSLSTEINQDDFRINIYRAIPVEIVRGASVDFTFSAAATPRSIASQAGVKVYPADKVTAQPNENFIKNGSIGQRIVIDPSIPVNLNLYGSQLLIRTRATTVAQLIQEENIHLSKTDQVTPAENTPLSLNGQIFITRQGVKIQTVTKTIPMPVDSTYVSDLAYGTSSIVQQGSAGQETVTYQENTSNGVVTSTNPIQTVITIPPVTEIVDIGDSLSGIQGDMALAGISPGDYSYVNYIVSHESGWCPTKWQGEYGYCPAGFSQVYSNGSLIGYGLCQSTPPNKMASFGSDWQTNPITQLEWCNWYANTKYHGWYNAYIFWSNNGYW